MSTCLHCWNVQASKRVNSLNNWCDVCMISSIDGCCGSSPVETEKQRDLFEFVHMVVVWSRISRWWTIYPLPLPELIVCSFPSCWRLEKVVDGEDFVTTSGLVIPPKDKVDALLLRVILHCPIGGGCLVLRDVFVPKHQLGLLRRWIVDAGVLGNGLWFPISVDESQTWLWGLSRNGHFPSSAFQTWDQRSASPGCTWRHRSARGFWRSASRIAPW